METDNINGTFEQQYTSKSPKKGILIFLGILAAIIIISFLITRFNRPGQGRNYIGVLNIDGTITSSEKTTSSYNQDWVLKTIDHMEKDKRNKGILLAIDSPGGSVYATAEVYGKLLEYKEKTGRPVYTYMESMAASGGYYIAMASDEVYANENCWTGSIGVIVGTIYDFSGFMDKLGIKGVNITSGPNKAMGGGTEPLKEEQKAIFQSIVDESYDRFVKVVCTGRDMDEETVRKIADGRIYTASQAKKLGLIDYVSTKDEAIKAILKESGKDYKIEEFKWKSSSSLLSIFSKTKQLSESESYKELFDLIEEESTFKVTYLAPIRNE